MIRIILILLLPLTLGAQSFTDRVTMVRDQYNNISLAEIQMDILMYESPEEKEPLYQQSVSFQRRHDSYHYIMGNLELMVNETDMVMISKETRQILVGKRNEIPTEMLNDPFKANMDSIMGYYDNPVLVMKNESQEHYQLIQRKGDVKKVDIVFDLKREFLDKVMYLTNSGEYVVIDFSVFDQSPEFDETTFQSDTYFRRNGGQLVASEGYIGYSVVLLTDNN